MVGFLWQCVLISCFFPGGTVAAQLSDAVALKIGSLPSGASIHRLDNGLRILLIEHPGLPMTGSNVVVKVGSAYERFATSGMSHMLEHLLFNGTETRTQEELYAQVDRLGAYNNANTGTYYTNFMMVAANDKIAEAMRIQADMLFGSVLPEAKFEKEKGIVLEEIARSLSDSNQQLERDGLDFLYPGHALSLPTLGTHATIKAMARDDVHAFYKNHYVPNNMLISVVGGFKASAMLEVIEEIYGKFAPTEVRGSKMDRWHEGFDVPESWAAERSLQVAHRSYGGESTVARLFFELPCDLPSAFPDVMQRATHEALTEIEAQLQARFSEPTLALRFGCRMAPVRSFLQFTLSVKGSRFMEPIIHGFLEHLNTLRPTVADSTLEAMVTQSRTDFLKNIEKPHMFGIYNAFEFATRGIDGVMATYDGRVFCESVNVMNRLDLMGLPRRILIHHPTSDVAGEPEAQNTETRVFEYSEPWWRLVVTQNPRSELLAMHYLVTHKAFFESQYGKDAARILHHCLSQRLDSDDMQAQSRRFGLTCTFNDNPMIPMDDIYLHPDYAYLRVEGLAEDLPGAIDFFNTQLLGFEPTEKEFETAVRSLQRVESPMGPMGMGGDGSGEAFDRVIKAQLLEPPPFPEPQDPVTYENLLAFSRRFFHPANMIVAVTSPAAPESVQDLFQPGGQHVPAWDVTLPQPYAKQLKVQTDDVLIDQNVPGDSAYLYFGFSGAFKAEDRPALQALGLILSDRITFDVREKQGLAYRMAAGVSFYESRAQFYVKIPTRKMNVENLAPQLPAFFDPAYISQVTQDELNTVVNQYLGRMMFRRLSSINQGYYRCVDLYFHDDPDYAQKGFEALKTVSLEQVMRAAQTYLVPKHTATIIMR